MFYRTIHSSLIIVVFLLIASFVFNRDFTGIVDADHAPDIKHLSGYAWSSNIGWISFRGFGPDYGVDYNTTSKLLSGYAWSSNIGWISFGCGNDDDGITGRKVCSEGAGAPSYPAGAGTIPSGPRFDSINNKLVGFARACSVFVSGCSGVLRDPLELGGWDGWVSMSGDTWGDPAFHYGVWFDGITSEYDGFAWGGGQENDIDGNNISPQFPGWISFSGSGGDGTGTCFDNIQNGNESAVDSGGRCGVGPGGPVGGLGGTCSDNLQNGNETGVDVGGRCGLGPNGDGTPGGDGTGTCFNNIQDIGSSETGVDVGGRCGDGFPGVRLCNDPFCGTPPEAGAVCTRSAYPIVGEDITWNADINPAGVSYLWTVELNDDPLNPVPAVENTDYQIMGGDVNSSNVIIRYLTEGPRKTTVAITDSGGAVLSCNASTEGLTTFDVLPLGFDLTHSGSMTARFIRSIRTVTFPDVEVSAVSNGDFNDPVILEFVTIIDPQGNPRSGAGSDNSLLVTASFTSLTTLNKDLTTVDDPNDYQKTKLRLSITKNQAVSAPLPTGDYTAVIRGTSAGIEKTRNIDLRIDNPSGGVIEI